MFKGWLVEAQFWEESNLYNNRIQPFCQILAIDQYRQQDHIDTDRWLSLEELCQYLPDHPAKATVYGYVSNDRIPYHKGAKRLRFLKSEIDSWLKGGRTQQEYRSEVDSYLKNQKRKRK